ncbi:hypothetical protein BKA67DRAFT_540026 [Truncatella angustata]|uniref:Uncharacterized protein n=1 Tax=Truncatella angustata TaxID=152316 RepID=A0A9P8UE18_9PEZI|nr:uncharacterized protein BKA67DRAFT_540026 [Truncatella angustata]KAH6648218.1 hypothetical protein BKA67DRAFT_540026 [Truncatella angustata]
MWSYRKNSSRTRLSSDSSQGSDVTAPKYAYFEKLPFSWLRDLRDVWKSHPWILLKDTLLLGFAIPGIVATLHYAFSTGTTAPFQQEQSAVITTSRSCNYGNSVAEARSMGCVYDSLATAWLPQYCRDIELTAEFERSGHGPTGRTQTTPKRFL